MRHRLDRGWLEYWEKYYPGCRVPRSYAVFVDKLIVAASHTIRKNKLWLCRLVKQRVVPLKHIYALLHSIDEATLELENMRSRLNYLHERPETRTIQDRYELELEYHIEVISIILDKYYVLYEVFDEVDIRRVTRFGDLRPTNFIAIDDLGTDFVYEIPELAWKAIQTN